MRRFFKIALVSLVVACVPGCTSPSDGIHSGVRAYFDRTAGKTAQSWSSERNGQAFGIGFFWNAVPTFHIVGVWIDTFFLWASLENTAMGHGAIIARQLQCNHLVVPEDYVAIQAKWTGDLDNSKISAILGNIDELRDAYKQGNQVGQALTSRSLKATSALSGFVVAKISDKITAKVAGKYTTKIVAKKIFGFAPLVGPLVAGTINTAMFVAPLENAAQEFYRTKARYVCA